MYPAPVQVAAIHGAELPSVFTGNDPDARIVAIPVKQKLGWIRQLSRRQQ